MWTFATLVAGTVNQSRTSDIDPEFIVIIALYVKAFNFDCPERHFLTDTSCTIACCATQVRAVHHLHNHPVDHPYTVDRAQSVNRRLPEGAAYEGA